MNTIQEPTFTPRAQLEFFLQLDKFLPERVLFVFGEELSGRHWWGIAVMRNLGGRFTVRRRELADGEDVDLTVLGRGETAVRLVSETLEQYRVPRSGEVLTVLRAAMSAAA